MFAMTLSQFAEVRNGETPSSTKPHLIIKPTLHTPVANLLSPVFPTNLLSANPLNTPSTNLSLHPTPFHTSSAHSPTYPKSPVPLHPLKSFTAANLASLEHLINNRQLKQERDFYSEQLKQEPDSPGGLKDTRQTIVERIRKRADLPTLGDDNKMNLATTVSRKRFHSENNGQIDDKRRKFLERNRAAAQRCREKRKHWINNLQAEKSVMQEESNSLRTEVQSLRTEVAHLKCMLLSHKDCSVTKAMQDGKLPRPPIFSDTDNIKKPSPTKPTPQHPHRNSEEHDVKPSLTPTSGANSDPLASILEGFSVGKDSYGRPRITVSPLFGPHIPRSPMIALSPFALGPSFGLMPTSASLEPHYTITSLDSRQGKLQDKSKTNGGSPQNNAENPCPEVVNGLAVLREALSKT